MQDYIIHPSKAEPFTYGNAKNGELIICGISAPFNPKEFYKPIIHWVDNFLAMDSKPLSIEINLQFYTKTTSSCLYNLFRLVLEHIKKGREVKVCWYYFPDEIDVMEDGEDFASEFNIPINVIEQVVPESFSLKSTSSSPLVYYDESGDVIIKGKSTGSKPWEYFLPLIKWLSYNRFRNEFMARIFLFLSVLDANSLNRHYLSHILYLIERLVEKQSYITVTWEYKNKNMKDLGEELLSKRNLNVSFEEC